MLKENQFRSPRHGLSKLFKLFKLWDFEFMCIE